MEREAGPQHICLLQPDRSRSNKVTTAKYTWYTFVPKNMFEQLSQLANAYFLLIAILQLIPEISNTGGLPLQLVPLSFVLFMGAVKDGFEDWKRHLSDRTENEAMAVAVDERLHERQLPWRDICPGMVLRVRQGERLAADGLLLASSADDGHCYVETANLDGESNLKKKTKIAALVESESGKVWAEATKGRLWLECEPPSTDLYNFRGAIIVEGKTPVGAEIGSLLLRGTSLQQTSWALILVVYCGHDTRVMQNAQGIAFKTSTLDKYLQKIIIMIFSTQVFMSIGLSIGSLIWQLHRAPWYLSAGSGAGVHLHHLIFQLICRCATWIVQTNALVPISLIVTMTGVKFVQGMFVASDVRCGDARHDRGAKVKTSQVIESLGQITHVFSDKTGTLTQNFMEYKACAVEGRVYGLDDAEEDLSPEPRHLRAVHVNFKAVRFLSDLAAASDSRRATRLASFLLGHALCHSVEVNTPGGSSEGAAAAYAVGSVDMPYEASSPDELALVCAARALGLEFVQATNLGMQLKVHGGALAVSVARACGWRRGAGEELLEMELLDVCEFDNDRKRMSVIIRYPDQRVVLLVKGADSSVLPYVDQRSRLDCEAHLSRFAGRGLRTLCFASRTLEANECEAWRARYAAARATVSTDRAQQLQACAEELETRAGLELLGATGIEDRLQDQVPETLQQLQEAGIRVWVLTGDKVETAVSIAKSCRLLVEGMTEIVLERGERAEHGRLLSLAMQSKRPALVVSGAALGSLLEGDWCQAFLEAAQRCCTVVCCRVSPKQKADVVALVKEQDRTSVTLSIGDGANDVSMIVTAHVGVGITGREGSQAALSADFSIAEFQYLRRLLFVHGRESYRRMSVLILYNFYKNWLMILPTILYATVSSFTGQNLFYPWLTQLYNVLFTHLPVCAYGILDQAVGDLTQLEFDPRGYAPTLFSVLLTAMWLMTAFAQALFFCGVAVYTLGGNAGSNGTELTDLWVMGALGYVWVVLGANITMAFRHSAWLGWVTWTPYLVNAFCLLASYRVLDHLGLDKGTRTMTGISDVLLSADNFARVFFTTAFAVVGHVILGEPAIRYSNTVQNMLFSLGGCVRGPQANRPRSGSSLTWPLREEAALSPAAAPQGSGDPRHSVSSFGFAFSEECAFERRSSAKQALHNTEAPAVRTMRGSQELEMPSLPDSSGLV